ncbi:MAG: hypothetical protein M3R27_02950 [Bacteroidota bacterium]|nr:hypothetical protein [Bacteroidota bacterium]
MKKIVPFLILSILALGHFSVHAKMDIPEEEIDNSIVIDRITNDDIDVILPSMIFTFSEAVVKLKFKNPTHTKLLLNKNVIEFIINGESRSLTFVNGEASFTNSFSDTRKLSIYTEEFSYSTTVTAYPVWAFIVPLAFLVLIILLRMKKNKA